MYLIVGVFLVKSSPSVALKEKIHYPSIYAVERQAMYKTINDVNVKGMRVLVRADLNVPVHDGSVSDLTRLERLKPTLDRLIEEGARVIVLSHFGRPKGKKIPELSLKPVANALSKVLNGRSVAFASDCIGTSAKETVRTLGQGQIAVLENLRFHSGEETNCLIFASELAELGDIYVNDGFSVSHRAHASTAGLASLLPSVAGINMQAELTALSSALEHPKRPVGAIVGGAKISTKLEVLGNLTERMDFVVIGGAMANTFLCAIGVDVGKSLIENDMVSTAREIIADSDDRGCELVLPSDVTIAPALETGVYTDVVQIAGVPKDKMILDIGPESVSGLSAKLTECRTLLWNGPLGAFEVPPFDRSTNAIAITVAKLTRNGVMTSIAGGGDTVAALNQAGVAKDFTYVSTAGGAFLEWLEGKQLPGVAALIGTGK